MEEPVDVVYLLSKGSQWQDNEIRYSLRSLEKHLKNYRNVYIVGYRPPFLNDKAIEIPFKDFYSNRSRNIMAKIHRAASDTRVTQKFILFNDDYFLLQDVEAPEYPYYFNNSLEITAARQYNSYKKYVDATLKILKENNLPTVHFDLHCPIIYDKFKFKKMVDHYNWNIPHGYIVKSMYCNHFGITGVQREDHKINYPYRANMLDDMNYNKEMFSISDKALTHSMKAYIMKKYPEKSTFEI
jgi:hypothetical protein